jgi:hypothetical protein
VSSEKNLKINVEEQSNQIIAEKEKIKISHGKTRIFTD